MKQAKKVFKKILLNNWGGFDHQVIQLNEYVNLFSGKSGSGKSSAIDAMQVVLYGSVAGDFLNQAADDSTNKRNVLSYLRGAQKDGSENRENQDFYSHIVLEIEDTGHQNHVCIGVAFEVGRSDQDLKKFNFFSHEGPIPEDRYLTEEKIPYSISDIQRLINARSGLRENKGRININRIYPSKDSYINTVNDVIYGYVDARRFKTMQKSAIALRMTKGTSQFIKDYMFPKSKEDTISAISEQLAAYREIKERVEDLENQITLLDEVQRHDQLLTQSLSDQVMTEAVLRILDIEDKKAHLTARHDDVARTLEKMKELEEEKELLSEKLKKLWDDLTEVKAEFRNSDLEKKKNEMEQLDETIRLYGHEAEEWRKLTHRLELWEETEGVTDYVGNPVLNLMKSVVGGEVTEEGVQKLKQGLKDSYDNVKEELVDQKSEHRRIQREYREQKAILDDLKDDKKHYSKELKEVRRKLQDELSMRYGSTIRVEVFSDLFDITDETWRNAIEGRLGRIKYGLLVEPNYALDAANIFRSMRKPEYESVDLINTAAIQRDEPTAQKGTLYEAVSTDISYVDLCLKRYLGHIKKCETVEELHEVRDGVTQDCYSYSNYMFRHLRAKDYKYPSIGKKVSKKQILELENDVENAFEQLGVLEKEIVTLNKVDDMERLQNYDYEKLYQLFTSTKSLKKCNKKAQRLEQEIQELERGTRVAELSKQQRILESEIQVMEDKRDSNQREYTDYAKVEEKQKGAILDLETKLAELQEGFVPNADLQSQVLAVMEAGESGSFEKKKKAFLISLRETEETERNERNIARMKFIRAYPSYDFSGVESDNRVYDNLLANCRDNFEPQYKEEFGKQYNLVYRMLRENVIATIHSEIKEAKRHRREINALLSKIRFSDSIYQIDILPVDDENRQFYDMLTAEELDMKVINREMQGQLSFGEDDFYQKYEAQIKRLTDKFMPPKEGDQTTYEKHRRNMSKYADYRTYLKFNMYEQVEDAEGNIKKNYVDDMAGRDSGGEGQNPKYVALMAGFAMLYHQQANRETKIRLVLLDEAFSKMDKERSEVCLHYARQLGLQLIVCVPDERLPSLVQNVDCVYAFRRANNRISTIYIDKGDYLKVMEGEQDEEGEYAGTLVNSEDK